MWMTPKFFKQKNSNPHNPLHLVWLMSMQDKEEPIFLILKQASARWSSGPFPLPSER